MGLGRYTSWCLDSYTAKADILPLESTFAHSGRGGAVEILGRCFLVPYTPIGEHFLPIVGLGRYTFWCLDPYTPTGEHLPTAAAAEQSRPWGATLPGAYICLPLESTPAYGGCGGAVAKDTSWGLDFGALLLSGAFLMPPWGLSDVVYRHLLFPPGVVFNVYVYCKAVCFSLIGTSACFLQIAFPNWDLCR